MRANELRCSWSWVGVGVAKSCCLAASSFCSYSSQQVVGASVHVVIASRTVVQVPFVQVKGGGGPGPVFQAVWFPVEDGGPEFQLTVIQVKWICGGDSLEQVVLAGAGGPFPNGPELASLLGNGDGLRFDGCWCWCCLRSKGCCWGRTVVGGLFGWD